MKNRKKSLLLLIKKVPQLPFVFIFYAGLYFVILKYTFNNRKSNSNLS